MQWLGGQKPRLQFATHHATATGVKEKYSVGRQFSGGGGQRSIPSHTQTAVGQ